MRDLSVWSGEYRRHGRLGQLRERVSHVLHSPSPYPLTLRGRGFLLHSILRRRGRGFRLHPPLRLRQRGFLFYSLSTSGARVSTSLPSPLWGEGRVRVSAATWFPRVVV